MNDNKQDSTPPFEIKRSRRFYETRIYAYTAAASLAYGMRVDRQTRTRWTELMMLGRAGDDFLDSDIPVDPTQHAQQSNAAATFIRVLENDGFAATYPSLSRSALGDELFDAYTSQVAKIVDVSLKAKQETSLARHMTLRALEGATTAKAVTMLATEPLQTSGRYQHFAKHLKYAGAISTLCDSAWEFKGDTKEHEIAIPYTTENYVHIVKSALGSSALLAMSALRKSRVRG